VSLDGIFDYGQGEVLVCLAGIAVTLFYVVVRVWFPARRDDDT